MSLKATNHNSTLRSWYNHRDSCAVQIKWNKCLFLSYQTQSKNWCKKKTTFCTQHFTGEFIQRALRFAALLICTLAVWQSSICSRRINIGVDGSPYRYYITRAKSILADRDTIQVHYTSFGWFFPLFFALILREKEHFSLRSYSRLTDRQEISINASIKRGKCCQQQQHRTKARVVQEVHGVICVITAMTVPMFRNEHSEAVM